MALPAKNSQKETFKFKHCFITRLKLKKNTISALKIVLQGLGVVINILGLFFLWLVIKPLKAAWPYFVRFAIVPAYKFYLLLGKQAGGVQKIVNRSLPWSTSGSVDEQRRLAKERLGLARLLPHVTIIILAGLIVFQNVQSKEISPEEIGTKSIMFNLIKESKELITEQNDADGQSQLVNVNAFETPQDFIKQINSPDIGLSAGPLVDNEAPFAENSAALARPSITETLLGGQPRKETIEYIVEPGDTVSGIAEKFNISVNTIFWENKLSSNSLIKPTDKLTILPTTGVSHKVKSGETLGSIAIKYGTEVTEIAEFNNITDSAYLVADKEIIIPGGTIKIVAPARTQLASLKTIFSVSSPIKPSSSGFIWPINCRRITQYYSWRHLAIDIGCPSGALIVSSLAGRIEKAGWGTGYGNHIVINHGGNQKTLYAHLSKLYVSAGDQVEQGDALGANGSTGWSTGPHLHFEIIVNGAKVNPLLYL